tara:strand:- start:89 stop:400 length:312 start_codon:yes stop_codon:yes gene_type:complete
MAQMKWEYDIHIRRNLGDGDNLQQESENHFLDIMGRDGWELISVLNVSIKQETPEGLSEDNEHLKYYFKRAIRPKTVRETQEERGKKYIEDAMKLVKFRGEKE